MKFSMYQLLPISLVSMQNKNTFDYQTIWRTLFAILLILLIIGSNRQPNQR